MGPFERANKRLINRLGKPLVIQRTGSIIDGVFSKEYVDTNDVSGYAPTIRCESEAALNLKRDDIIERGSELYKFILEQPDGEGFSLLILQNA